MFFIPKETDMDRVQTGQADIPVRQSLVAQTVALIRRDGLAGRWPEELPGERALAVELQISRSTLRLALRQLEREGFLATRRDRHVFVGRVVTPAIQSVSNQVAFLSWSANLRLPYSRIMDMEELHEMLQGAGLQLKIVDNLQPMPVRRMRQKLADVHRRLQPVCWILFSCPPEIHRWFLQQRIPAIVSGSRRADTKLPSVDFDNFAMARHAVGKLLALGHRRIGLLVPDSGLMGDLAAEAGFMEACNRHQGGGLAASIYRHDRSPAGLIEQIKRFAGGSFPAALVVTHYWYTITSLTWLLTHGVRVPEDVSLICLRMDRDMDYVVPAIHGYEFDKKLHTRKLARLAIRFAHTGELNTDADLLLGRERPGASLAPGPAGKQSGAMPQAGLKAGG
jgi:DNA-binding LacI/PurR family transcriptional regulator/DNA-binding transcriptional regulator YhcF (GntR family)